MPEPKTLIEYHGPLTFSVISRLLAELKVQLDSYGEKMVIYKRILIIMVEVLENINKYFESQNGQKEIICQYPVSFRLIKIDNQYLISATNVVTAKAKKIIEEKIELVNKLDNNELRELYREIISNGQFSDEGGAGLGFIELAKTSQNKLSYSFEEINDTFVYYTINLEISVA